MKQPARSPKRYGRRTIPTRSRSKTQIIGRKRVPLDVELEEENDDVSPLDLKLFHVNTPEENDDNAAVNKGDAVGKNAKKDVDNEPSLSKKKSTPSARVQGDKRQRRGSLVQSLEHAVKPVKPKNKFIFSLDDLSPKHQESTTSKACSRNQSSRQVPTHSIQSNHTKASSGSATKKSAGKTNVTGASASTAKTKNTARVLPRSKFKKKSPKRRVVKSVERVKMADGLEMKTLRELPARGPPPGNITVRSKGKKEINDTGEIQVWQDDDEVSALTGVTKKRVLRDLGNQVNCDNGAALADITTKRALNDLGNQVKRTREDATKVSNAIKDDKIRTKSARKKRKSALEDDKPNKKHCIEKKPCVIFTVPQFEAGRHGEDKYQERKYLGLIEGIGGGVEEKDKESNIPHRGRLLELPGELMTGTWKAQVINDASGDMPSKRISLRHISAKYSSLESHLQKEDQVSVSIVHPLKNRVRSFIDQGILDDDEIGEDEEKVLGSAFIGCISLAWFDGFTSASEAVNLANDESEKLLKQCARPAEDGYHDDLCKIVQNDSANHTEECVRGVLLQSKLSFEDTYSVLISHLGFEIDAVDVVFKEIRTHSNINGASLSTTHRSGLTQSLISHHLDCVGSSEHDVINRFKDGDGDFRRIDLHPKPNSDTPKNEHLVPTISGDNKEVRGPEIDDPGFGNSNLSRDHEETANDLFSTVEKNHEVKISESNTNSEKPSNKEHQNSKISSTQIQRMSMQCQSKTSPALEAVKKRAYTTIHSPSDLKCEKLQRNNDSTTSKNTEAKNDSKTLTCAEALLVSNTGENVHESILAKKESVKLAIKSNGLNIRNETVELKEIALSIDKPIVSVLPSNITSPSVLQGLGAPEQGQQQNRIKKDMGVQKSTTSVDEVEDQIFGKATKSPKPMDEPTRLSSNSEKPAKAHKARIGATIETSTSKKNILTSSKDCQQDVDNAESKASAPKSTSRISRTSSKRAAMSPHKTNRIDHPIPVGESKTEETTKNTIKRSNTNASTLTERKRHINKVKRTAKYSSARVKGENGRQRASRRLSYPTETIPFSRKSLATSNIMKLPTPSTAPHSKRIGANVPATTHKSTTRKLFYSDSNRIAKKKLEYSHTAKSASKKKEFIGDLFGDNESMFGIPTIKTPASHRRRRSCSTRKTICNSEAKVDSAPKSSKTTASSQHGSINSTNTGLGNTKSPIVTPSGSRFTSTRNASSLHDTESAGFEDSQTSDIFHDVTSVSVENQEVDSAVVQAIAVYSNKVFSTPQRTYDVYFGQDATTPLNSRKSPSSAALILKSPESGAFYDYYFGQGHYNEMNNDKILLSDQPVHDVYFGQHTDTGHLLFADLRASPETSLTFHDSYFGQEDITSNDFTVVDSVHASAVLQKPRFTKRGYSCFILLIVLSMFHATMQPANTRCQRNSISINDLDLFAFNVTIKNEQVAEGWFSRLF